MESSRKKQERTKQVNEGNANAAGESSPMQRSEGDQSPAVPGSLTIEPSLTTNNSCKFLHEFLTRRSAMKEKRENAVAPQPPATLLKIEHVKIEISPIQFKDAKEMRKAFDQTHEEVQKASATAVDKQSDVLIALAKMRSLLSQRGSEKMRKEAEIDSTVIELAKPTKRESIWMAYFNWYKQTYNLKMCLRTAINKMDLLMGKQLCTECKKEKGHTPSCSKYKEPKPKHLTPLEAKLIEATSAAHEVVTAHKAGGNVNEAIKDFTKIAPTPGKLEEYLERPVRKESVSEKERLGKQVKSTLLKGETDVAANAAANAGDILNVLTAVSNQLQQGELAIKVRTLIGKLIGRPTEKEAMQEPVTPKPEAPAKQKAAKAAPPKDTTIRVEKRDKLIDGQRYVDWLVLRGTEVLDVQDTEEAANEEAERRRQFSQFVNVLQQGNGRIGTQDAAVL